MELSIVILCYRSEEALIPFVKEVKQLVEKLTKSYEIVLVGNYIEGSTDRTKEIVQQLASENSCYKEVTKPKKGMMGWDMIEGLKIADGKYICVIDGDGQFPIESIEKCYNEIKTGKYSLVKTYRTKRYDGFYRVCISKIYNFIFSILFPGLGSKDVNSKPKMLSREAYNQVKLKSTKHLVSASKGHDIKKFVFISSRTAGKNSGSYVLSKCLAEQYIKENLDNWIIFRPQRYLELIKVKAWML